MGLQDYIHTGYFRNFGPRFTTNVVSKLVGLIITIVLARYLGPAQLGYFSFVASVAGVLVILFGFGLPGYLQRSVSHAIAKGNKFGVRRLVSAALGILIFSSAAVVLISFLAGAFAQTCLHRPSALLLFSLAGMYALSLISASIMESILIAHHRLDLALPYAILRDILRLCLVLLSVFLTQNFIPVVISYAIAFFVYALLIYRIMRRFVDVYPLLDFHIIRAAIPYLFFGIASLLLAYTDVLMLSYFRPMSDVGYYRAAFLVVTTAIALLPFAAVSLPTFSRAAARGELRAKYLRLLAIALLASLFAVFVLYFIGPYLILFFYGPNYSRSIPIFHVLVFLIPANLVYSLSIQAIIAVGREWEQVVYPLIAGVLNLVLNYLLILHFGTIGAAYATVFSMWIAALVVVFRVFLLGVHVHA